MTPSDNIAHYRLIAKLGEGGMGAVYRAADTRLNRDVAIKVLPPAFAGDADRMARFEREAQVLASLNHPNIAAIYGIEAGAIVMELVDGADLAGPLSAETALGYARQIAAGLEAAHEKGIIHRDLKPANIKVTPDGTVKLLDFGLAKATEQSSLGSTGAGRTQSPTLSLAMTQAGMILGTAAYMSPEQARGYPVDRRADIWAFGVVLYEMLTGAPLFQGETTTDILASVVKETPDLERVPREFRRLLRTCLQKNPKERLQAIGDWHLLLEEPAAAVPAAAPPHSRPTLVASWGLAGALALGLAALAAVHFREVPPEPAALRLTLLPPADTTLDFTNGLGLPALSPDGRRIVFGARTADGKVPLWVRSLDTLIAQPLTGTDGATFPFWSPDSRYIGFFADGALKKIDAAGGAAITLTSVSQNGARGGTWGPNGVIVFAPRGSATSSIMEYVSSSGGASTVMPKASGRMPCFLPDGKHFLATDTRMNRTTLLVYSLDGGEAKTIGTTDTNAVFSRGYLLFLREGTLMAQPFDAASLSTTGEAVPIAEQVEALLNSRSVGVFTSSATGLLVYRSDISKVRDQARLTWFDRKGSVLESIGDLGHHFSVAISPDGKRVAEQRVESGAGGSARNNASDIWLYDLTRGAGGTRFTSDPANDGGPVWSPDGTHIVFTSDRTGASSLYEKDSSGARGEELLLQSPEQKWPLDWSADGRFLLYSANAGSAPHLFVLPMTGDDRKPRPYLQTQFAEMQGRFSPDTRWVAYASDESGKVEVYVRPFPDAMAGKWIVSSGGGSQPRWRGDGKELFYISRDQKLMAVDVSTGSVAGPGNAGFRSGTPKLLFAAPPVSGETLRPWARYDVTADGRKFLLAAPVGNRESASPAAAPPLTMIQNWQGPLKK